MDQNQNSSLKNPEIIEPNQDQNQKTPEITLNPEKSILENQSNNVIVEQPSDTSSPIQPLASLPKAPANPLTDDSSQVTLVSDDNTEKLDEIGKTWIKKAEEIIKKNKNKPFKEEEDHEDLEIDYLKKRFGKILKKGNE